MELGIGGQKLGTNPSRSARRPVLLLERPACSAAEANLHRRRLHETFLLEQRVPQVAQEADTLAVAKSCMSVCILAIILAMRSESTVFRAANDASADGGTGRPLRIPVHGRRDRSAYPSPRDRLRANNRSRRCRMATRR